MAQSIKAAEMRSSGIGGGRVRMHMTGRCNDDDGLEATSPGNELCKAADVLATEIVDQNLGHPVQDAARLSFTTCRETRGTFDRGTFGIGGTFNRGTFGRDTFGRAVNSFNRAEPVSFKRFSFHVAQGGTPTNDSSRQETSSRPSVDICDGDDDDFDHANDDDAAMMNDMAMFYEDTSASLQNILNERREKKEREAREREQEPEAETTPPGSSSAEKELVPTGEVQGTAWMQEGVDRATFTAQALEPFAVNQYREESREPDAEPDLDAHSESSVRQPSQAESHALMQENLQSLPVVVATTTSLLRTLQESGGLPSVCTSLEQKAESDGEPEVGECCELSADSLGNKRLRSQSITSLGAMSAPVDFTQPLATPTNMQASSRRVSTPTKEQLSPTEGQQVSPTKEQRSVAPAAPTAPAPEGRPRRRTNPTLLENRNNDCFGQISHLGYAPKQQEMDIQMKQLPIMKMSDVSPSDVTPCDSKPSDVKPSDAKLSECDQLNVFVEQMIQQIALSAEAPGRHPRNHADVRCLDAHSGSHKSKSDEWEEASLCYSSHSSDGEEIEEL